MLNPVKKIPWIRKKGLLGELRLKAVSLNDKAPGQVRWLSRLQRENVKY
jgi:hypothetical protein